jgi:hypothetical protein
MQAERQIAERVAMLAAQSSIDAFVDTGVGPSILSMN